MGCVERFADLAEVYALVCLLPRGHRSKRAFPPAALPGPSCLLKLNPPAHIGKKEEKMYITRLIDAQQKDPEELEVLGERPKDEEEEKEEEKEKKEEGGEEDGLAVL